MGDSPRSLHSSGQEEASSGPHLSLPTTPLLGASFSRRFLIREVRGGKAGSQGDQGIWEAGESLQGRSMYGESLHSGDSEPGHEGQKQRS